jgi:hypothetical protein
MKIQDLDPHPDSLVKDIDTRIRIHTKIAWIHITMVNIMRHMIN